MMSKILIVEDELPLLQTISYNLEQEGYQVIQAQDGLSGLDAARTSKPDLILLDIMLPGIDGLEVCRLLRKDMDIPIIILTAKSREIDKVVGLEVGADDYVTKPFGMLELLARVRAALRRARTEVQKQEVLRAGNIELDVACHTVKVNGQEVDLRPKEF
ncbi:MAG TPA: response regulator, partial [Armatimonadota bacterium]|nr:response regulator [Armatimonadota bacterium]